MIVVDAAAALSALFNNDVARRALAADQLHAPHLIDSEVASGLRRVVLAGRIDPGAQLRDNLSAYDAGYVALAEALGCGLLTADARLSNASGTRCPITVVPR